MQTKLPQLSSAITMQQYVLASEVLGHIEGQMYLLRDMYDDELAEVVYELRMAIAEAHRQVTPSPSVVT
jgi:hypothetical protein